VVPCLGGRWIYRVDKVVVSLGVDSVHRFVGTMDKVAIVGSILTELDKMLFTDTAFANGYCVDLLGEPDSDLWSRLGLLALDEHAADDDQDEDEEQQDDGRGRTTIIVVNRPDHWFFVEKGASDLVVGHGELAGEVGDSCEGGEGGWLADVLQVLHSGDGAVGAGAGGLPIFRQVGDKGVRTGAGGSHWASEQAKVRTSKICARRWEPFDWLKGAMRKLQAMRSVSKLKCPFFSRVGQDVVGFEPALVATGPEELAREVNKT